MAALQILGDLGAGQGFQGLFRISLFILLQSPHLRRCLRQAPGIAIFSQGRKGRRRPQIFPIRQLLHGQLIVTGRDHSSAVLIVLQILKGLPGLGILPVEI